MQAVKTYRGQNFEADTFGAFIVEHFSSVELMVRASRQGLGGREERR